MWNKARQTCNQDRGVPGTCGHEQVNEVSCGRATNTCSVGIIMKEKLDVGERWGSSGECVIGKPKEENRPGL